MEIKQISCETDKQKITRFILEALPNWFGIQEAREGYIQGCANKHFLCAVEEDKPVGFLYLKETGKDTVEIAVMGVLEEYQKRGAGKYLFNEAKWIATNLGYSFIQVKTVQMGKYEEYDRTNMFYLALGFKELEVFPTLWDVRNPCQIYIMAL